MIFKNFLKFGSGLVLLFTKNFFFKVLAHLYNKTSLTKNEQKDQYFSYCPKEFQFDTYRYPLLLKEIHGLF